MLITIGILLMPLFIRIFDHKPPYDFISRHELSPQQLRHEVMRKAGITAQNRLKPRQHEPKMLQASRTYHLQSSIGRTSQEKPILLEPVRCSVDYVNNTSEGQALLTGQDNNILVILLSGMDHELGCSFTELKPECKCHRTIEREIDS